jgi:putative peptidoglycan lipid II flippase
MIGRLLARLPRGALLLSAISAINVLFGFVREAVMAYHFGASAELDAFLVAFTLPRLVAMQLVQITVSLILPLYVGHVENGDHALATALLRKWFRLCLMIVTGVSLVILIGSELVTRGVGPGLSAEAHDDAARWLRWLVPYLWLVGITGCFKVVLDTHRRFAIPAAAGALVSICMVIAVVAGADRYGIAVVLPALAVAGALTFLIQWWPARTHEPTLIGLGPIPANVRLPVVGGGILVLLSISQQTNTIIDRAFASYLPDGSIAALNFANSLADIPSTILSMALATALFPVLAGMTAKGKWRLAFRTTVNWALVVMAIGAIPVAILVFFSDEVVRLVFGRGAFDAEAVERTATALMILSATIWLTGATSIVNRLMLSQRQLVQMLLISVFGVSVKIIANVLLVSRGIAGVAWATVIAGVAATLLRYAIAARLRNRDQPEAAPP